LTSPDGIAWTEQTSGTKQILAGVTFGNGMFVAICGHSSVLKSLDGINWEGYSSNTPAPPGGCPIIGRCTTQSLAGITYGNGIFAVAAGSSTYQGGLIVTSPNGRIWTVHNSGIEKDINGICYGNGKFVAVGGDYWAEGSGIIRTSSDNGRSWSANTVNATTLSDAVFYNNQFVIVGRGNTILTGK
jgi:hypothetical protein